MELIPEIQKKKTGIEEDRSIAIEAAIVRIMKARKGLSHSQLVSEVIICYFLFFKNQIQFLIHKFFQKQFKKKKNIKKHEVLQQLAFFRPNVKVIKQRIEHLIEREYLERDPNQASMYRYLA